MAWSDPYRPGLSLVFVCRGQCDEFCHEEIRNHVAGRRALEDHPADAVDLFPGLSDVLVPLCPGTGRSLEPDAHRPDPYHGGVGTDRSGLWHRVAAHLLSVAADGADP